MTTFGAGEGTDEVDGQPLERPRIHLHHQKAALVLIRPFFLLALMASG